VVKENYCTLLYLASYIRSFMFSGDLHTVAPYNAVHDTDSMAKTEILEDPNIVTAIW
jgi:hypothetical protein